MTAELEQTTVFSETQEPAHCQGNPCKKPTIEGMPPLQRKELFSLVGVIADETIARALRERRKSVNGVGLVFEEENCGYSPEPYGYHYEHLGRDDLVVGGMERINEGFLDTLEMHAWKILNAAKNGKEEQRVQRTYDRMTMISARTGINIGQLITDDAILTLLCNMEGFTEKMLDESLASSDRDFKEKAISSFDTFWEKHAEHAGPHPSEDLARKLWEWYADLVSDSYFCESPLLTTTNTE